MTKKTNPPVSKRSRSKKAGPAAAVAQALAVLAPAAALAQAARDAVSAARPDVVPVEPPAELPVVADVPVLAPAPQPAAAQDLQVAQDLGAGADGVQDAGDAVAGEAVDEALPEAGVQVAAADVPPAPTEAPAPGVAAAGDGAAAAAMVGVDVSALAAGAAAVLLGMSAAGGGSSPAAPPPPPPAPPPPPPAPPPPSPPPPPALSGFDGKVVGGTFTGLRAFYDADGDGEWDANEVWGVVGADGSFKLAGFARTPNGKVVIQAGGVDKAGHVLSKLYFAGGDATHGTVSLLSTALATTPGLTQAALKASLGINNAQLDLLDFDFEKELAGGSIDGQEVASANAQLASALDALATVAGGGEAAYFSVLGILGAQLKAAAAQAQGAPMKFALDIQHALAQTSASGGLSLSDLVRGTLETLVSQGLVSSEVAAVLNAQIDALLSSIAKAYDGLAKLYADLNSSDPAVVAAAQAALASLDAYLLKAAGLLSDAIANTVHMSAEDAAAELVRFLSSLAQAETEAGVGGADPSVISGDALVSLKETDAALHTEGKLTSTASDGSTVLFKAQNEKGFYGQFSFDANGNWTYTANSAFNELAEGEVLVDSFVVADADGNEKTVIITITGTNDAAVIGGGDFRELTETDDVVSTGGQLTSTDVDGRDNQFIAQTDVLGSEGRGKFSIDANGKWTYNADNSFDVLAEGESLTDYFWAQAADGTRHKVTVKVVGTNDASKVTGDLVVRLLETDAAVAQQMHHQGTDMVLTTSGQLFADDVDGEDNLFNPEDRLEGEYGYLTLDEHGNWVYTGYSDHDEFEEGEEYTDTFTVYTRDGTPVVITIIIEGTNDAAVISGSTEALLDIEEHLGTRGQLVSDDVDGDDNLFRPQDDTAGSSGYGRFTLDEDGTWTYTLNPGQLDLDPDTTYSDSFTAVAADGTEHVVTVTFLGSNKAFTFTDLQGKNAGVDGVGALADGRVTSDQVLQLGQNGFSFAGTDITAHGAARLLNLARDARLPALLADADVTLMLTAADIAHAAQSDNAELASFVNRLQAAGMDTLALGFELDDLAASGQLSFEAGLDVTLSSTRVLHAGASDGNVRLLGNADVTVKLDASDITDILGRYSNGVPSSNQDLGSLVDWMQAAGMDTLAMDAGQLVALSEIDDSLEAGLDVTVHGTSFLSLGNTASMAHLLGDADVSVQLTEQNLLEVLGETNESLGSLVDALQAAGMDTLALDAGQVVDLAESGDYSLESGLDVTVNGTSFLGLGNTAHMAHLLGDADVSVQLSAQDLLEVLGETNESLGSLVDELQAVGMDTLVLDAGQVVDLAESGDFSLEAGLDVTVTGTSFLSLSDSDSLSHLFGDAHVSVDVSAQDIGDIQGLVGQLQSVGVDGLVLADVAISLDGSLDNAQAAIGINLAGGVTLTTDVEALATLAGALGGVSAAASDEVVIEDALQLAQLSDTEVAAVQHLLGDATGTAMLDVAGIQGMDLADIEALKSSLAGLQEELTTLGVQQIEINDDLANALAEAGVQFAPAASDDGTGQDILVAAHADGPNGVALLNASLSDLVALGADEVVAGADVAKVEMALRDTDNADLDYTLADLPTFHVAEGTAVSLAVDEDDLAALIAALGDAPGTALADAGFTMLHYTGAELASEEQAGLDALLVSNGLTLDATLLEGTQATLLGLSEQPADPFDPFHKPG